jgi:hypothetical protein
VKRNLGFVGFLQATGLVSYISFVAGFITNAEKWIPSDKNILGPMLFLSLLVLSATICGLIFGAYAFTLAWEEKKIKSALRLCVYTIGWLIVYLIVLLGLIIK